MCVIANEAYFLFTGMGNSEAVLLKYGFDFVLYSYYIPQMRPHWFSVAISFVCCVCTHLHVIPL